MLARQSNDSVRVRLEVEPPRGMALVSAVHGEHDQVGAVFDVADDDAVFFPRRPPDGREAQRTPAALVRRGLQEPAATELVEGSMSAPGRVHEPRRRDFGVEEGVMQQRTALQDQRRPEAASRVESLGPRSPIRGRSGLLCRSPRSRHPSRRTAPRPVRERRVAEPTSVGSEIGHQSVEPGASRSAGVRDGPFRHSGGPPDTTFSPPNPSNFLDPGPPARAQTPLSITV